jgi:hypothetical protein
VVVFLVLMASISLTQHLPLPPAWSALLAKAQLAQAQLALSALLASTLQLDSVPPVLSTHTSLPQAPPLAWPALLATSQQALALPFCLVALPAILASTIQLDCVLPASLESTSLPQLPHPAWSALLATPPTTLALPSNLSALPALLGSTLRTTVSLGLFVWTAQLPSTSLPQPLHPAWSALAALVRGVVGHQAALFALLASMLQLSVLPALLGNTTTTALPAVRTAASASTSPYQQHCLASSAQLGK